LDARSAYPSLPCGNGLTNRRAAELASRSNPAHGLGPAPAGPPRLRAPNPQRAARPGRRGRAMARVSSCCSATPGCAGARRPPRAPATSTSADAGSTCTGPSPAPTDTSSSAPRSRTSPAPCRSRRFGPRAGGGPRRQEARRPSVHHAGPVRASVPGDMDRYADRLGEAAESADPAKPARRARRRPGKS